MATQVVCDGCGYTAEPGSAWFQLSRKGVIAMHRDICVLCANKILKFMDTLHQLPDSGDEVSAGVAAVDDDMIVQGL
jgi:hypothetical protein